MRILAREEVVVIADTTWLTWIVWGLIAFIVIGVAISVLRR